MEEIIQTLKEIEKENNIEILYAIESGSRAWGFSNEESDYDIRFIFKRPIKDYISLKNNKDALDITIDDYDIVGWDIKKTLSLHYKDNPNLREWIKSPIVYMGNCDFLNELPDFDKDVLKYHYASIAFNVWKEALDREEMDRKSTKRYLYCIRCILAWKSADLGKDSSISIFELMEDSEINDDLKSDINTLIDYYKSLCKNELDEELIDRLSIWIDETVKNIKDHYPKKEKKDMSLYDDVLFKVLEIE